MGLSDGKMQLIERSHLALDEGEWSQKKRGVTPGYSRHLVTPAASSGHQL